MAGGAVPLCRLDLPPFDLATSFISVGNWVSPFYSFWVFKSFFLNILSPSLSPNLCLSVSLLGSFAIVAPLFFSFLFLFPLIFLFHSILVHSSQFTPICLVPKSLFLSLYLSLFILSPLLQSSVRLPLFLCLTIFLFCFTICLSLFLHLSFSIWLCFHLPHSPIFLAYPPRPCSPRPPPARAPLTGVGARGAEQGEPGQRAEQRLHGAVCPPPPSPGSCRPAREEMLTVPAKIPGRLRAFWLKRTAPSRGPSAPRGLAEPGDPAGGCRTCQPGRLLGKGPPWSSREPGRTGEGEGRVAQEG